MRRLLRIGIMALAPLATGCSFVRVAQDPYFDAQAFAESPPRTLAVAPFKNQTRTVTAGEVMRRQMFGEISTLGYEDVELAKVDGIIRSKAEQRGLSVAEFDETMMLDPDLADAVVFGDLVKVSKIFLLLYSHHKVELRLAIYDARSRKRLYQNHFIVRNINLSLPTSLDGIVSTFASTLWFMRDTKLDETLSVAAEEIGKRLPDRADPALTGGLFISRIEVAVERQPLKAGDRVLLRVAATPGQMATFALGRIIDGQPLWETSAGLYEGTYVVQPGQTGRFVYATITLTNPQNPEEQFVKEASEQPFAIDTVPPPAYEVTAWSPAPSGRGVRLRLGPRDRSAAAEDDLPAQLAIYRARGRAEELQLIGTTTTGEFDDESAEPGVEYDYAVIAYDAAGNAGPVDRRVTVRVPDRPASR